MNFVGAKNRPKLQPSYRIRRALPILLAVMMLGSGIAYGKKKKPKTLPPPPADLAGHVDYLARQLYGVPLDESGPITNGIQKLVVEHLDEWLAHQTPTDEPGGVPFDAKLRRELESVFILLRYPLFGQPAVFARPWQSGLMIGAGYTLGWTDYDRVNVLALYESIDGRTHRVALTNFVPRTDLHYESLPGPAADRFWFMVYGTRLGKSHPRLTAILYSFDGSFLKSLWETDDVYDGRISVSEDRVIIRYLREEEFIRATAGHRNPPRHEAVYKVKSAGLELESDHEVQ